MGLGQFSGFEFFFARACTPAFEKRQKRIALAIVFAVSCSAALLAADEDRNFVRGIDSRIHSVRLNRNPEEATRNALKVSGACTWIKSTASAAPLVGSEGSTVEPSIKSKRGVLVLEGLVTHGQPKILSTALLSPFKNYPTSIAGETGTTPSLRYALAITLAAQLAGTGDLVLRKGDGLTVHADGQLYTYALPDITIPSEGLLRLYAGTDDTLYYDAALTHPFHAGICTLRGAHGR